MSFGGLFAAVASACLFSAETGVVVSAVDSVRSSAATPHGASLVAAATLAKVSARLSQAGGVLSGAAGMSGGVASKGSTDGVDEGVAGNGSSASGDRKST